MSNQPRKSELEVARQTVKFFKTVLSASADGIVITDSAQNIVTANDSFSALFGRRRREVVETSIFIWLEQLDSGAVQRWEELERRVRHKGEYRDVEFQMMTEEGPQHINVNASLLERGNDEEEGVIVSIWRDITERKWMEESLREAELRYRTMADFTHDWEYWENPDGTLRYVSPSCERITGYKREQFSADPTLLQMIMLPEDKKVWKRHRHEIIETPGIYETQFRIRHRNGEVRWIEHICRSVTDEQGTFLGLRSSNRDITEHKRAEQSLEDTLDSTTALYYISRSLVAFKKLPDLLQAVVDNIALTLSANRVMLATFDMEAEKITNFVKGGTGAHDIVPVSFGELNEGLTGWVLREGKPAISPKNIPDPRESLEVQQRRAETNCGAIIVVPLQHGDRILGTITAINLPDERGFTQPDVKLMTVIANQAAAAIENTVLHEQLQREIAERKQTGEEIHKLSRAVEQSANTIMITDAKGIIEYVNPAFTRITGYTSEEIIGQHTRILRSGEMPPEEYKQMWETINSGHEWRGEFHNKQKNGELYWASSLISPIKNSEGVTTRFLAIQEDVTARKQAEDNLYESREQWRSLTTSSPDFIIVLDSDLNIQFANKASPGLTVEQIIGTPIYIYVAKERQAEIKKILESVLRTGESARYETEYYHPDRSIIYYESRVVPRMQHDQIVGLIISTRDVTEHKKAEEERGKRLKQLATLHHVEADLTRKLNIDYVLTMALDVIVRLSLADNAAIGLIEEDGRVQVAKAMGNYSDALRFEFDHSIAGRVIRERQAELVTDVKTDPDYHPHIASTRAQIAIPLISQDRLIGIVLLETSKPFRFTEEVFEFLQLITGRVAVAIDNAQLYKVSQQQLAELQNLYTQVSQLEHLKTDMIRIAAHDLRNPLAVISGYAALLDKPEEQLSKQQREYIGQIALATQQMSGITDNVLSLERIEATTQEDYESELDLSEVAREAFEYNRGQAQQKAQDYALHLPAAPLIVHGDAAQLGEAIGNLISNAVKYTPDNGRVAVRLQQRDGRALFEVEDSGYGVPEDQQERLFQPFFRVRTSETAGIEGTGLGLYLVKSIIKRHKGQMYFHCVHGEGSTFGFELSLLG